MPAAQKTRTPAEEAAAAPRPPLRSDQARKLSKWLEVNLDEHATVEDLLKNGVKADHLRALEVQLVSLLRANASLSQLRQFGFDALDLAANPPLAGQLTNHFTKAASAAAFLDSPSAAVAIAASRAMNILGITPRMLLKTCAGAPTEALSVFEQLIMRHAVDCRNDAASSDLKIPRAHPFTDLAVTDLAAAGFTTDIIENKLGIPVPQLAAFLNVNLNTNSSGLAALGYIE